MKRTSHRVVGTLVASAALTFAGIFGHAAVAGAAPDSTQQVTGYCAAVELIGDPPAFTGAGALCVGPGFAQLAGFCGADLALSTKNLAPGEWVYLEIGCNNAPLAWWTVQAAVTPAV